MHMLVGLAMAAIVAAAAIFSFSPRPTPPLAPWHLPVERMQLNTLARFGQGLVAGGELGHILLSADGGKTWTDAAVTPRRYALINQIVFADERTGMAVGHEGSILRTEDGGKSWREVAFDEQNGVPLMSIAKLPSGQWLAVGAFGRAQRSSDDGKTWEKFKLEGNEDLHLNRLVKGKDAKDWLLVGEHGLVRRSGDGGATWTAVPAFYNGSFYNAAQLDGGTWLVHGMRGNVYRSSDAAAHWTKSEMPAPISTFASARSADGRRLLVGQSSMVLASTDDGATFRIQRRGGLTTLMDIAVMPDGSWLLPSDFGLQRLDPAAAANSANARPAATGAKQ